MLVEPAKVPNTAEDLGARVGQVVTDHRRHDDHHRVPWCTSTLEAQRLPRRARAPSVLDPRTRSIEPNSLRSAESRVPTPTSSAPGARLMKRSMLAALVALPVPERDVRERRGASTSRTRMPGRSRRLRIAVWIASAIVVDQELVEGDPVRPPSSRSVDAAGDVVDPRLHGCSFRCIVCSDLTSPNSDVQQFLS